MRTLWAVLLLASAASVLMTSPAWSGTCLTLTGGEPETELACLPLEKGTPFFLEFINSIFYSLFSTVLLDSEASRV